MNCDSIEAIGRIGGMLLANRYDKRTQLIFEQSGSSAPRQEIMKSVEKKGR